MSIQANFPLLESDQAEVIAIFNGLLRELYGAGHLIETPMNQFLLGSTGSSDPEAPVNRFHYGSGESTNPDSETSEDLQS